MSENSLTKKQQAALDCTRNIAVTAGAGTGKTFILVERYLDILINHDTDIRQVLAITFTRKAAAEMMKRVAERLNRLLQVEQSDKKREHLVHIRDYLSAAYISTIHSFCARILREYPVEAGIDPDFVQLNDIQYEILFKETFDETLGELGSDEESWLDLFRFIRLTSIEQMLREALVHRFELRAVLDRYENATSGSLFEEIVSTFLREAGERTDPLTLSLIGSRAAKIVNLPAGTTDEQPALAALRKFLTAGDPEKIAYWQALWELRNIFTTRDNKAYLNLGQLGGKDFWGADNTGEVLRLSSLLAGITDLPGPVPSERDRLLLMLTGKFFKFYRLIEKRFTQKKQQYNAVDYEDLQLLVYDLLQNNENLREEIAKRFRYIMVDEFQDTNALQWEIISMLGGPDDRKHFIVGDPKQSIYGFRNADVRVFQNVRRTFTERAGENRDLTDIVMEDSFRFKSGMAEFINRLFAGLMNSGTDSEWEVGYDPMSCRREDPEGGIVELALLGDRIQPEFIAASIKEMESESGIPYGDMAVLLRTRNHLVEIEEMLRREGIPFKTIGGIGFFQRQEIYDVYHLIRFLISPADDVAVVGLLRSPFAGISDASLFMLSQAENGRGYWEKLQNAEKISGIPAEDRGKLARFRNLGARWLYRRDRMSFNELLDNIFSFSGFRAIYASDQKAARYLANLDKILEQAVEFEQAGFSSLADFGEALQNLIRSQIQESEAPVDFEDKTTVKIMTIHQAKGLEFPVVILPYLEQRLRPESYGKVIFDEIYGFAPPLTDEDSPGFMQHIVRNRAHRKAVAELKRLFYVGCTRARDRLLMLGTAENGKIPEETPLRWLTGNFDIDPGKITDGMTNDGLIIHSDLPEKQKTGHQGLSRIPDRIQDIRKALEAEDPAVSKTNRFLPPEDRPEGEIFSATQLMIFSRSPAEYFERYHLGYFASDYDFNLSSGKEEDAAILRGKLIHKYFEEYPEFDLARTLSEYEITDSDIVRSLGIELQETIGRVRKSDQISGILSAKEFVNELSITKKTGNDFLTGTIDRLYRNQAGDWEIIDYKTNRISHDDIEKISAEYRIQIEVYALLLAGLYPGQECYRVNLYFTHIDILRSFDFDVEDLDRSERRLQEIIDGIRQLDPYMPAADDSQRFAFKNHGR